MTLKDILPSYRDRDILARLRFLYPDQKKNRKGYVGVLKRLRKIRPSKSTETIVIKSRPNDRSCRVLGFDGETFALDFTTWSEFLGMEIEPETLWRFPHIDIICYALWEMTYHGFTERQIYTFRNRMLKKIKESSAYA